MLTPFTSARARWVVLAALANGILGCSSDSGSGNPNAGGSPAGGLAGTSGASSGTGGSAGLPATGGSAGSPATGGAGGSNVAGMGPGGSGGSGGAAGGSGGNPAGSGGISGAGGSSGGSGGAAGSGGTGGAGGASRTAIANITGVNGQTVTGTATFTQTGTMTRLVLNLTACPNGSHVSHLHAVKSCANNGAAAGDHWVPNGENLGNYTCADGKGMHMVEKPSSTWTVGDGGNNDVARYSFMVHAGPDPNPGDRIGCGVINAQ